MAELKVAYAFPIYEEGLKNLKSVSPDVKLVDIVDLLNKDNEAQKEFGASSPEARSAREESDVVLGDVEVLYSADLPMDLHNRAPKLKWLQYVWDGVDIEPGRQILDSPIVLTNGREVGALCIAEWVIMTMLMFIKKAPQFMAERKEKKWGNEGIYQMGELRGKTLGVLGLGAIGKEVARLGKAFGMRVIATRRSITKRQSSVGYVDELLPATEQDDLLKESDFVALCVPLIPETTHLIGEHELNIMKPTAYIFNVARGSVIDEPVLVRALKEGWIAGAGLDVFETEPMPPDNELWELPNAITAPHISGNSPGYEDRMADLFCQNLERYIKGEELINVVNQLGY